MVAARRKGKVVYPDEWATSSDNAESESRQRNASGMGQKEQEQYERDQQKWGVADPWIEEHRPNMLGFFRRISAIPKGFNRGCFRDPESRTGHYWRNIWFIDLSVTNGHLTISATQDGKARALPDEARPTQAEAEKIAAEIQDHPAPKSVVVDSNIEDKILKLCPVIETDHEYWLSRNLQSQIVLMWERVVFTNRDGAEKKKYIPWCFFEDQVWRMAEPEGKLPLYGLEFIGMSPIVCVHEGVRSAQIGNELMMGRVTQTETKWDDHIWADQLSQMVHVGWSGGAQNPHRTDWTPLREHESIARIVIAADHDQAGEEPLPHISKLLNTKSVTHFKFPDNFPEFCDLADYQEFPDLNEPPDIVWDRCCTSGTWVSQAKQGENDKTFYIPNPEWEKEYVLCTEEELWVHKLSRNEFTERGMEIELTHLMHQGAKLPQFLLRGNFKRVRKIGYYPGNHGLIVGDDVYEALNMWRASRVEKLVKQGVMPTSSAGRELFQRYLEHLIPDLTEREQFLHWLAHIIAQPQRRAKYGTLLISRKTGIGKSFASMVMRQLVGSKNFSMLDETELSANFNMSFFRKRVLSVEEVYQGHSFKVMQKLKPLMSQDYMLKTQKNKDPREERLHCHLLLSSNSMNALRVENHDRRLFIPTVSEQLQTKDFWAETEQILTNIEFLVDVYHWLLQVNSENPLPNIERAPDTQRKQEIKERSQGIVRPFLFRFFNGAVKHTIENNDVLYVPCTSVREWFALNSNKLDIRFGVAPELIRDVLQGWHDEQTTNFQGSLYVTEKRIRYRYGSRTYFIIAAPRADYPEPGSQEVNNNVLDVGQLAELVANFLDNNPI